MSKPKITSTIDYLSDPRKGITAAILLVLLIVAVVFLWKKIKGLWDGSSIKGAVEDGKIESATGSAITMTDGQFRQLCQRLLDALATSPIGIFGLNGTNEDEIYAVLGQLNTQADYLKLCTTWTAFYDDLSVWKRYFSQTGGSALQTLQATLKSELTKKELQRCRDILAAKGITPDF